MVIWKRVDVANLQHQFRQSLPHSMVQQNFVSIDAHVGKVFPGYFLPLAPLQRPVGRTADGMCGTGLNLALDPPLAREVSLVHGCIRLIGSRDDWTTFIATFESLWVRVEPRCLRHGCWCEPASDPGENAAKRLSGSTIFRLVRTKLEVKSFSAVQIHTSTKSQRPLKIQASPKSSQRGDLPMSSHRPIMVSTAASTKK